MTHEITETWRARILNVIDSLRTAICITVIIRCKITSEQRRDDLEFIHSVEQTDIICAYVSKFYWNFYQFGFKTILILTYLNKYSQHYRSLQDIKKLKALYCVRWYIHIWDKNIFVLRQTILIFSCAINFCINIRYKDWNMQVCVIHNVMLARHLYSFIKWTFVCLPLPAPTRISLHSNSSMHRISGQNISNGSYSFCIWASYEQTEFAMK